MLLELFEIFSGFIGLIAILIVFWDHFKDDRLLTKQVQEFYEDIENLIYTFIQYKSGKGSPKDNPEQRNLYYHFKVKQNFDAYSKYLGLTIFEQQEKYFNNSDCILRTTGELWHRSIGVDEQRLLSNYKNIKNIDPILDYLKILRDHWEKSYGKILFRRKLKQKKKFYT